MLKDVKLERSMSRIPKNNFPRYRSKGRITNQGPKRRSDGGGKAFATKAWGPTLNLQNPCKKAGEAGHTCHPSSGRGKEEKSSEFTDRPV